MPNGQLSARELILALIDTATRRQISAGYAIAAGGIFAIDPGNIRVTLARLVAKGALTQLDRGLYGLGNRDGTLQHLLRNWQLVEQSTRPWQGHWIGVLTQHLGRSDKTALRGRERALQLFGFAQTNYGVWLRPDNLVMPLAELAHALHDLGLEEKAVTAVMSHVEPAVKPEQLWSRTDLEAKYRELLNQLADSHQRTASMHEHPAAKERLLLGRAVTRQILLDPLLPQELVDTELRAELVAQMHNYDQTAKQFWRAFYWQHHNDPTAPATIDRNASPHSLEDDRLA